MKSKYQLINPYIEGSLETMVVASNPFEAGKKIYRAISTLFSNITDTFYFTIKDLETKRHYHFGVQESDTGDGRIDYHLRYIGDSFSSSIEDRLSREIDLLDQQQYNGDIEYSYVVKPINRFVYFAMPYHRVVRFENMSEFDKMRFTLPTFSFQYNPIYELRLDFFVQ